jgi:leucyl/phenylalanyl-tRNA---protein transferase
VPVYRLGARLAFPDPRLAEATGLLAAGGDLSPERLLLAYSLGIFPWHGGPPILWYSPDPRAVVHPGAVRISRRLRRTLRQGRFELRLDGDFRGVMEACAGVPRPGQDGTWITPAMVEAYTGLHRAGLAHSAEAWRDGRLVGGLYGLALGSAFFGESMFHRERDASKAAFAALLWQLDAWGFDLFDGQLPTPHLASLGLEAWPRERFLAALAASLERPTRRGRWHLEGGVLSRTRTDDGEAPTGPGARSAPGAASRVSRVEPTEEGE